MRAMTAAQQGASGATTIAATDVDACVSTTTIQDVPHSANTAIPSAQPATPAITTSGQLRLSLGRLGVVASMRPVARQTTTPRRTPVVLALNAAARFA